MKFTHSKIYLLEFVAVSSCKTYLGQTQITNSLNLRQALDARRLAEKCFNEICLFSIRSTVDREMRGEGTAPSQLVDALVCSRVHKTLCPQL